MRPIPWPEPRLWRSASFRLLALYVLLFALSSVLLGGVVFWIAQGALDRQMRVRIRAETASLVAEARVDGLGRVLDDVRLSERGAGTLVYRLQAADGRRLAGALPWLAARPGWIDVTLGQGRGEAEQKGENPERVRALVTGLGGGVLLAVGDDLGRAADAETAILGAFAWATGLVVLLGIGGGLVLSRGFLQRVDAIGRTAEAIIQGDLRRRIPVSGVGDDLDRLAGTLNRMLDRIAALMESLRQVSSDVAHDLRTPLSRLLQQLDTARSEANTVADYRAAVDAAAAEAETLLATFAAVLRIAQVEAGGPRARFRPVDLSALVLAVAEAYAPAIEAAGHRLACDATPGIALVGDRELLAQVLANLIENALRHCPVGCTIRLILERTAGRMVLAVADDGPGVPEAERGRIFERFFRAEHSRTTPGSGLGLAMVAAVAELHGAAVAAEDARPGLRVRIDFPAAG